MSGPVLTLPPLGDVVLALPEHYAARTDLVQAYLQCQDDSPRLARVYAAAIGLCWTGERPPPPPPPAPAEGQEAPAPPAPLPRLPLLPRYAVAEARIVAYGGEVEHALARAGVGFFEGFREAGVAIVDWVAASIPSPATVKEKVNFTFPSAGK